MEGYPKESLGVSVKKFLGLATIRRSTDKERKDAELHNENAAPGDSLLSIPFVGIEYSCSECNKTAFAELYDPWSYNTHAHCTHCNARADFMPNGINYGLSIALLFILAEAAGKRHTNWFRIKFAMLSYTLFGIPADLIPADREGKTLHDVETEYFFLLSHLIMSS